MYLPHHFAGSADEAQAALGAIVTGELITATATGPHVTFLPLLYDVASHSLQGHLARANEHWRAAATGDSLVIVRGPDAYISPSWYASKAEHGRVVPTWNYSLLQVRGPLVIHDDVEWLRGLVTRLTERHESAFASPWAVTDAPERYIDGQLKAIVGISVPVNQLEYKAKLSQNRSEADQAGVVAGLRSLDLRDPVAQAMEHDRP